MISYKKDWLFCLGARGKKLPSGTGTIGNYIYIRIPSVNKLDHMKCTYCKEEGLTSNLSFSMMGVFHFKKMVTINNIQQKHWTTETPRLLYFFCCTSFHNEYCWGPAVPQARKWQRLEMFSSRGVASSKWKPKLLGRDGVFFFSGDRIVFLKQALHDFHGLD